LEFITGAGVVARGGGRVVKNVAGFDLTRLLTGSWGSLGIITEVTVRLHARPECDETFAIGLDEDNAAGRVRQLTRRLPFTPYACEILNAALAAALLGREQIVALFRLGGNADAVRAQRAALAELGDAWQVDTAVWGALNDAEPKQAAVFRLSHRPSEVEGSWSEAAAISAGCRGTLLHASPARGIVRCIVPQSDESTAVLRRAFATPTQNTRVGERLPTELWPLASAPPVNDVISSRIKRAFDPASVLNPGILGDRAEDIA
jgi:glycolate oxidase FAD binding subunit